MSAKPVGADYPVTITVPVQWADMDALGHVNNACFFTWLESVRIVLFDRVGVATNALGVAGGHADAIEEDDPHRLEPREKT